jgi:cytoskeletal protein CcmA (bactofilin family)
MMMSILRLEKIKVRLNKVLFSLQREVVVHIPVADHVSRIATGTTVVGLLSCPDNCYFDGVLNGDLIVANKLVLGANSEVSGALIAGDLLAKGKLNASVKVTNETVYCSTAIATCPLMETNALVVESGAVLNMGELLMPGGGVTVPSPAIIKQPVPVVKTTVAEAVVSAAPEAEKKSSSEGNRPDDSLLFQFFNNK